MNTKVRLNTSDEDLIYNRNLIDTLLEDDDYTDLLGLYNLYYSHAKWNSNESMPNNEEVMKQMRCGLSKLKRLRTKLVELELVTIENISGKWTTTINTLINGLKNNRVVNNQSSDLKEKKSLNDILISNSLKKEKKITSFSSSDLQKMNLSDLRKIRKQIDKIEDSKTNRELPTIEDAMEYWNTKTREIVNGMENHVTLSATKVELGFLACWNNYNPDWKDNKGNKIKNWRTKLTNWITNNIMKYELKN